MEGLHLTADLYQCNCSQALLTDAGQLAALCRRHTLAAGLTLVDEKWHGFAGSQGQPGGVTGMLLLAESHLAVHTWPERQGVTLDVYVCNYSADNSAKAQRLMTELLADFQPQRSITHSLQRGDVNPQLHGETLWESLDDDSVYGFRISNRLLTRRTPFQLLELLQTRRFGKVLRLDGKFMTSEGEEFYYHEALVHPAAIAHPAPQRALIIGGGDGGAAEELLKHPTMQQVIIAELDGDVVAVAREHLRAVHRGALDDPRVKVQLGDGFAYLRDSRETHDLILLDLTDPETPAGPLYTRQSFQAIKHALRPRGALVLHLGAPSFEPEQIRRLAADLRATFAAVDFYGLYIPLYGAYWALAVASDDGRPSQLGRDEVARRLAERRIGDLRYYNADVHPALFALPTYYRDQVAPPAALSLAA